MSVHIPEVVGGALISSLSEMVTEAVSGEPTVTVTAEIGLSRLTMNRSSLSMTKSSTVPIVIQSLVENGWNVKPSPEISP